MSVTSHTESGISIPKTSSHFLDTTGSGDRGHGRLRYLTGGTGPPWSCYTPYAPKPRPTSSSTPSKGCASVVADCQTSLGQTWDRPRHYQQASP